MLNFRSRRGEVLSSFCWNLNLCFQFQFLHRKKSKSRIIYLLLGFFTLLGLLLIITSHKKEQPFDLQCSDTEVLELVKRTCQFHQKGKVIGNLCSSLCTDQAIVLKSCLNYREGKHVVLVDCVDACEPGQTIPAVLKSSFIEDQNVDKYFSGIDRHLNDIFPLTKLVDGDFSSKDDYVEETVLVQKISETLLDDFGSFERINNDLISVIMGDPDKHRVFHEQKHYYPIKFLRTLWSLLSQHEYKMSTFLSKWELFPRVLGNCGQLYLSELAPYDERFDYHTTETVTWRKRVSTAIKVLNLISIAENLETPLHFCDVKLMHFGLTSDSQLRFIDSDTVFTNKTLKKLFTAAPCNTDKDCNLFDCLSRCDAKYESCLSTRTNTNLEIICSVILKGSRESVHEGILTNPPRAAAAKIQKLLQDCIQGRAKETTADWIGQMNEVLINSLDN